MKHRDTKFHFNDNLTITTDASGNQTISGSGTGGGQDNLSDNFNGTYIYQDDAGNMHTAVDSGQDNENYTTNWSQSYPSMNVTQSDNDPVSDSWTYVVDGNTLSQGGYSVNYGNEGNSGGSTQATYDPDDLGGVGQDFPGASFNTAGTSSFGQWPPAASSAQPTGLTPNTLANTSGGLFFGQGPPTWSQQVPFPTNIIPGGHYVPDALERTADSIGIGLAGVIGEVAITPPAGVIWVLNKSGVNTGIPNLWLFVGNTVANGWKQVWDEPWGTLYQGTNP